MQTRAEKATQVSGARTPVKSIKAVDEPRYKALREWNGACSQVVKALREREACSQIAVIDT